LVYASPRAGWEHDPGDLSPILCDSTMLEHEILQNLKLWWFYIFMFMKSIRDLWCCFLSSCCIRVIFWFESQTCMNKLYHTIQSPLFSPNWGLCFLVINFERRSPSFENTPAPSTEQCLIIHHFFTATIYLKFCFIFTITFSYITADITPCHKSSPEISTTSIRNSVLSAVWLAINRSSRSIHAFGSPGKMIPFPAFVFFPKWFYDISPFNLC